MRALTSAVASAAAAAVLTSSATAGFSGVNGRIVFASTRSGNTDIYVMNADGTGETRLTTDATVERMPAWSPGGNKIAYIRDDDLWVMNADGSGQTSVIAG